VPSICRQVNGTPPFAGRADHESLTRGNTVAGWCCLLLVTWTGTGTPQSAGQMTGPWRDLTNSISPYVADPATAAAFYRLRN
jgi:hypothetical protein